MIKLPKVEESDFCRKQQAVSKLQPKRWQDNEKFIILKVRDS